VPTPAGQPAAEAAPETGADAGADRLSGTLTVRNAHWKAEYLANPVEIAQGTLHLGNGQTRWDPVIFSYGAVKGTASLEMTAGDAKCDTAAPCPPRFSVRFGALDAGVLQAAILGAHEKGTLLSTLLARLQPATAPAWPLLEGTVKADSLILGPVTLKYPTATLHILASGAEITGLDAELLGGQVHGSGTLHAGEIPAYELEGGFAKLSPAAVGSLVGMHWSGSGVYGTGKIELSGFTDKDLTASAKGNMHFELRRGAITGSDPAETVPAALTRFDSWTADAEIAGGAIVLKENQVRRGAHESSVTASVAFGTPPKVTFAPPKGIPSETEAAKR